MWLVFFPKPVIFWGIVFVIMMLIQIAKMKQLSNSFASCNFMEKSSPQINVRISDQLSEPETILHTCSYGKGHMNILFNHF